MAAAGMMAYTRPAVPARTFRDAAGRLIDYGNRWGGQSPPEDTYSVVSNPERFAPLHTVAEALIASLGSAYDVAIEEGPAVADDLLHRPNDVVRAVRVTPTEPDAAALTFVLTSFPGVIVHAGLLHDFLYPVCGCDACDETWQAEADELERQVFAVVAGGYQERVRRDAELEVEYALTAADGSRRMSGRSRAVDCPQDRLRAAERRLDGLAGGWRSWRLRAGV